MKPQISWLRVFVEGVVIVGSILLALAADAWWDERGDRVAEREYHERLAIEITRDSLSLVRILGFNGAYRQSALDLIRIIEAGRTPADDPIELAHLIAWAGHLDGPQAAGTGAFEEMVSSGQLGLIRDVSLRQDLILYHQLLQNRVDLLRRGPTEFQRLARQWLPAGFTRAAQQCLWDEYLRGQSRCRTDIAKIDAERALERMEGDPAVADYLREIVWYTDDVAASFESQEQIRVRVMAALERARNDL